MREQGRIFEARKVSGELSTAWVTALRLGVCVGKWCRATSSKGSASQSAAHSERDVTGLWTRLVRPEKVNGLSICCSRCNSRKRQMTNEEVWAGLQRERLICLVSMEPP